MAKTLCGKIHFTTYIAKEFFNLAPFLYLSLIVSNDAFTWKTQASKRIMQ